MKSGLVIEESKVLETHLNLVTDFTGSLLRMLSTENRWFSHLGHLIVRRHSARNTFNFGGTRLLRYRSDDLLNASVFGVCTDRKSVV